MLFYSATFYMTIRQVERPRPGSSTIRYATASTGGLSKGNGLYLGMGTFGKLYSALFLNPSHLPREGYKDCSTLRDEEQEVDFILARRDWVISSIFFVCE